MRKKSSVILLPRNAWLNHNETENSIQGHYMNSTIKIYGHEKQGTLGNVPDWRSQGNVSNWNPGVWREQFLLKDTVVKSNWNRIWGLNGRCISVSRSFQRWHHSYSGDVNYKNTKTAKDRWQQALSNGPVGWAQFFELLPNFKTA